MIQPVATPRAAEIHLANAGATLQVCREPEVLLEGPAGASKTVPACIKLVKSCAEYPGSHFLLCRKTRRSMIDTCLITLESVIAQYIGVNARELTRVTREQRHSYRLWGSEIVIAGLDEPSKSYGSAWGLVVIEEAIEIGREPYELFFRSARDPKLRAAGEEDPFPYNQYICVTNPGPSTHWLNKRATAVPDDLRGRIRDEAHWLALRDWNRGPQRGQMRRLVATHWDNPTLYDLGGHDWTPKGREYIANLERMSGHRRKWMLEGQWCAPEGTVFAGAFSEDNLIAPFDVPGDWPIWVLVDPGEDHPCAVGWFTRTLTGKVILIAEVHGRNLGGVEEVARLIKEKNAVRGFKPIGYYLDPRHGFATTFQATETIAQQFANAGLPGFMPWPRFQGAGLMASVERCRTELKTRSLLFFNDCDGFIGDFQTWAYKRSADGSVPKGDDAFEDANNDGIDVTRGFLGLNLARPSDARNEDDVAIERMRELEADAERHKIGGDDVPGDPLDSAPFRD